MGKELYAGIEGGGTKFVCIITNEAGKIIDEHRFATTTPEETIQKSIHFLSAYSERLRAVGIASFGPVDLHPDSSTYGFITETPKNGWSNTNILKPFQNAFDVPISFDLDVNAAALGEYSHSPETHRHDPFVYFTIGTGIGAGVIVNGKIIHGLVHPEMGHIRIPHNRKTDPFDGICPFHGDCFEGLASGPAIKARWGICAKEFDDSHEGWNLEAEYIAFAVTNAICSYSPKKIILGGGVMEHNGLIQKIQNKVQELLHGYIKSERILHSIDQYITLPTLGNRSGVIGAIELARTIAKTQFD